MHESEFICFQSFTFHFLNSQRCFSGFFSWAAVFEAMPEKEAMDPQDLLFYPKWSGKDGGVLETYPPEN